MLAPVAAFVSRLMLVMLFFPFSALDKIINAKLAVKQAGQAAPGRIWPALLVVAGLGVEIFMSLGVLTGVADRACAAVLASYCVVTAVLWKPFWRQPDFRFAGVSAGRDMFWDFLKNFALAGGFLVLALGSGASSVREFFDSPLATHHPYRISPGDRP